ASARCRPGSPRKSPPSCRTGPEGIDLNYLYHRQQISMMRAAAATCDRSRAAHQGLADGYGGVIASERSLRGVPPAP
ncbi:hypothetical protein, partial [Allosphingosinicella sp.]|uniref:hypothetical protein n=1 Tax=Allosphingosinicella sp. TaxID=2823234 RepID=UPI002FC1BEA7